VKSLKANVLCAIGIALAIFSVGCGDAIQKSQSTVAMFGYVFLSCSFLAVALVLCAIGVSSENERIERENRKVKHIPHHTNEWRDAR
jgi:hypothetical protein